MTRTARALTRAALVLAATAAASAPVIAQPPGGGGGGRGAAMMNQMMFEGITLTPAQQAKIDSIRAANRPQGGGGGTGGGAPDSAAMAARRERMQAERTAIRAVLTAEQQPTFDKNLQAMEERMRAMRAQRGGTPPR